ncbi:hypothetical protein [Thalassobius sp. I31.1]|uniref:hypothetical protein n=1 Tax=Thalassobius sp. I31.1 TaxID=2109912 RepID=UPI000D1B734E|nr:hypothetical protein [Thalassobius sp. I31.1]
MDSRDQIIMLALSGSELAEISRISGTSMQSVHCTLRSARKRFMEQRDMGVKHPSLSAWGPAFRKAASRRNLSINQLAQRILETVATEDLFDAVLDDLIPTETPEQEGAIA